MRPLTFAALLLTVASRTHAQTRIATPEAGALSAGSQTGSLTSTLPGGGAPQLITLNLTAPSLGLTPGHQPTALAPTPLLAAAPLAVPTALPTSFIARARPLEIKPAQARLNGTKALFGEIPDAPDKTPVGSLIELTKRMFAESSKSGYQSAEYLRPSAPFQFGTAEVSRYRTALSAPDAKTGNEELKTLVATAGTLARSAGITVEAVQRDGVDGAPRPALRVTPERHGHRLNRLAWDLQKNFDSAVEYAPSRTNGGVAAYNSREKVLFLPDFGHEDAFEAILHESRHAAFSKRLSRAELSVFHPALLAYQGRSIAPNASTYDNYMSLEELSTHAKTLLHGIVRAQRTGQTEAASGARANAYQFIDILRSAEINLFLLQRLLERGALSSYPLSGANWPAFPGGHWEAINLPHAILALPVLDGPPEPPRSLWSRLFKDAPESHALTAARRHAAALRPLVAGLTGELEIFLTALKDETPDLKKARDSAVRMVSLADRADKSFAAAP